MIGPAGDLVEVPGSALLEAALRRRGVRVHVGPLLSAGRLVGPDERRRLAGRALAVDMESAWLAAGAGGRPFAVVRVVADAAGRRLADPRLAVAGVRALDTLRRVGPALAEWGAAVGPRTVLLARPRSFCAGVERTIDATANRRHSVRAAAREADVVLVAGSQSSSNSQRLVEAARREGARAYLVDDETEVDVAWLAGAGTVAITAGASAPEWIVTRLVDALRALGPLDVQERTTTVESRQFKLPKEVAHT